MDNDVVYNTQYFSYIDPETNLEWAIGTDVMTNWFEAKGWVDSLGGNWRMPFITELETLFKPGVGVRNMPPEIEDRITGWYVWSGESKGKSCARILYFYNGKEYWYDKLTSNPSRAFAVRSIEKYG